MNPGLHKQHHTRGIQTDGTPGCETNAPDRNYRQRQETTCAWLGVSGSGVGVQSISTTNPVTPGWQGIAVQQGGLRETSTTLFFFLAEKKKQKKRRLKQN